MARWDLSVVLIGESCSMALVPYTICTLYVIPLCIYMHAIGKVKSVNKYKFFLESTYVYLIAGLAKESAK
jgi:hypothetical protein